MFFIWFVPICHVNHSANQFMITYEHNRFSRRIEKKKHSWFVRTYADWIRVSKRDMLIVKTKNSGEKRNHANLSPDIASVSFCIVQCCWNSRNGFFLSVHVICARCFYRQPTSGGSERKEGQKQITNQPILNILHIRFVCNKGQFI